LPVSDIAAAAKIIATLIQVKWGDVAAAGSNVIAEPRADIHRVDIHRHLRARVIRKRVLIAKLRSDLIRIR
jgi:hypothetical protein